MNLHVVAYPELAYADYEKIQGSRAKHNSLYGVIAPHFTIVFSVADIPLADFSEEIKRRAEGVEAIRFCFRCAVINKDSFSENYDAFLVPDEGFSQISKLHDRLYGDRLSQHERLDIGYLPHLSIANSTDAHGVKKIVDQWNETAFEMYGTIPALDIINYENRVITTIERIFLGNSRRDECHS